MYLSPQRRRLCVIVFFVSVFACLTSHGWEANRRRQKQLKWSSQSEASAKDSSSEAANKKRPQRTAKRSNQSIRVHQEAKTHFSANQIYRTDILQRINKIGWSESYRPIKSLGQLFNRYITVTFFGESTRSDGQNRISQSYHLYGYFTVINGHSLRRHPQDWMVRPWSLSRLRAKVGLSCPQ